MNKKFQRNAIVNNHSSIFIATFSYYNKGKRTPANGMIDSLLSFFLPKVRKILLLDQPHLASDTVDPIVEVYNKRKLEKKFHISKFIYLPIYLLCKIPSEKKTRISYKLRDFFSVIYIALTQNEKYDLFVGLESINTLAGLVLKKIGIAKAVVYYVSDYSPVRFGNTLFNVLYLWLDRFCVKHADFTWDVSPAIQEARIKGGLDVKNKYRVIHVPNALFSSQIKSLSISKRTLNALVYMGVPDLDFGVDLAIRAFKEIKNRIPDATLRIVGGGKNLFILKNLAKELNLENSVIFYGFVINNNEMAKIVRSSYVGLAPYRASIDSFRWYGDAGKIRQYMASGLPVITTHVPPLGRLVAEKGAAIIVKDTVQDFSKEIVKLLLDKKLYRKMSEKAKEFSKENTWENTYSQAFQKMEDFS